jgi:UDP-glucuronate 4-epimerase
MPQRAFHRGSFGFLSRNSAPFHRSRMKILLTGAAGFIGSHLTERLLAEGHRVVGIDNFDAFYSPRTKRANLLSSLGHPSFRLVECDIRDPELGLRAGESYDVLIHLAAKAGVRPSMLDPADYWSVNIDGTRNLLGLAQGWGIRRVVLASSSSVYGENPRLPWNELDTDLIPVSPYAATKLECERLGADFALQTGIDTISLRLFTVFGPRQRPDLAIHKFARRMLSGEPIEIYGDGSSMRDYTYVDDVIDGIVSAVDHRQEGFDLVNLGSDRPVSLRDLIRELEQVLQTEARIRWLPFQPGDLPRTWADISRARHLLGYSPRTSLQEGLERFARWLGSATEVVPDPTTPIVPT